MAPNEEAAAQWERTADADRRAMEVLVKADVPRDVVVFHAQQWVEKLLKAIIALRGEDPPRAHDPTLLLELAGAGGVDEELASAARELTPYAVMARYPGLQSDLDPEGCRRLVEHARSVAAWASAQLQTG
jgi:HEPN domain-containing protein